MVGIEDMDSIWMQILYGKINDQVRSALYDPAKWNYVVLTYSKADGEIKLYIYSDSSPSPSPVSLPYDQDINIFDDVLIFGKYNAILDEITIRNRALIPTEIDTRWNYYTTT